ncbi:hypothetical protein MC885_014620 [Smutsia gigantea]|nr:hypothetical protein MC885_014620 [Smutsia gigantea]
MDVSDGAPHTTAVWLYPHRPQPYIRFHIRILALSKPQPNTMTSSYTSSSHSLGSTKTPGARYVSIYSTDIGCQLGAEAKAASLCLSAPQHMPIESMVLVLLILQQVSTLKCQLGDQLWIELDTESTVDPVRVLEESEGISLQATSCSEESQCCQSEILELRCPVSALEVECQAQHVLEGTLVRHTGTLGSHSSSTVDSGQVAAPFKA